MSSRKCAQVNIGSERFIPHRCSAASMDIRFDLKHRDNTVHPINQRCSPRTPTPINESKALYDSLLKNEILGCDIESITIRDGKCEETPTINLFTYSQPLSTPRTNSPWLKSSTQKLLQYRSIAEKYKSAKLLKTLDAPGLCEDFYLNLIDWSCKNVIAIGLDLSMYLFLQSSIAHELLLDFSSPVSAVRFSPSGDIVVIGTTCGDLSAVDVETRKVVNTFQGFKENQVVQTISWKCDHTFSSAGKSKRIFHHDMRMKSRPARQVNSQDDQVCGLSWSEKVPLLASGGNSNRVLIWDARSSLPITKFCEHTSAIKALSWSPQHCHLLASGGGSQDKTIKLWNVLTGKLQKSIATGSQVCNLAWLNGGDEILSTHGYPKNEILVWNYRAYTKVTTLSFGGYCNERALFLAISPDCSTVAVAGGEIIQLWNLSSATSPPKCKRSSLNMFHCIK